MTDFEQGLLRLEKIAEQLRDGSVPIDEATALFEQGIELAARLDRDLQAIEKRIEIVSGSVDAEEPEVSELPDDTT